MSSHLLTNNGLYLSQSTQALVLSFIRSYVDVVRNDLLPAFGDLEARADAVSEARFDELGATAAGEDSVMDMGDLAEDAQDTGITFYLTMTSLRQASINLCAVGLYHLIEQQLASICRDGLFTGLPAPIDGNLRSLHAWYAEQLEFDLGSLAGWDTLDELRLVANTTKHAEGGSARQLRERRPDLFQDPITAHMASEHAWLQSDRSVGAPLAGDGLFVKDSDLEAYGAGAICFVTSMIQGFKELQRY